VENTRRQLANEKFTARAPAHVIEEMKTKLADYETQIERSRRRWARRAEIRCGRWEEVDRPGTTEAGRK